MELNKSEQKMLGRISKLHDALYSRQKEMNMTTDTGTMKEGWVSYTVSCKKSSLLKKIKELEKWHKRGYPVE